MRYLLIIGKVLFSLMKIIVVGIGKVGYTVAEQLSGEMHDITIVDTNERALSDAVNALDVIGVHGNGAAYRVLDEAGVSDCDLLLALTDSDEVNLLCCLLGRKLGASSTIARVRNPEYSEELELIKDSLGLSMSVNPEKAAAAEMLRILQFPSAMNVETFAKGKMDLVSFIAEDGCYLCGREVKESFAKIGSKALICAVERNDEVFIPSGDFVIEAEDTVAVLASPKDLPAFFSEIGIPMNDIKNIMIIGGGRIGYYLATELDRLGMGTTIIERDVKAAEKLSFLIPDANVICGDGTDRALLLEEGLRETSALCCLTGIDEENILLSLYAKSVAPEIKTITKVNRIAFQEVIRSLDIGSVIYPKYTTASLILQHVRAKQNSIGSSVETLYKFIDNKVEALEFFVRADSALVGKTLEELTLRSNVLIGCITRDGRVFIPHGKDMIQPGDTVIVVTTITGLDDLDDIKAE